jgi:hypothetical protein
VSADASLLAANVASRPLWCSYVADRRTAVAFYVGSFPRNLFVILASRIVRQLAVWLVKQAIRDAAANLGVDLAMPPLGGS